MTKIDGSTTPQFDDDAINVYDQSVSSFKYKHVYDVIGLLSCALTLQEMRRLNETWTVWSAIEWIEHPDNGQYLK